MIPTAVLLLAALAYVIFVQPKLDERKANQVFDASVVAYLTGLKSYISECRVSIYDVRSYALRKLECAHKLPGNQFLFEYQAPSGLHYTGSTGPDDYPLFAMLCLVHFALDTGNQDLLDWSHSMLEEARKAGIRI